MEQKKKYIQNEVARPKGKKTRDLTVDGSIILKWIQAMMVWTGLVWFRIGTTRSLF
jgi:hypothetical protein